MADKTMGAEENGHTGLYVSDEHQRSVNQQSLHILQIIAELHEHYPNTTDISARHSKLQDDDARMWHWIVTLGLIEGEPGLAALTTAGKQVLDEATQSAGFRETLQLSLNVREASDRHAAAVLALLQINYDLGHVLYPTP